MGESEYQPIEDAKLYKSNTFISAKYKSTLIENQITAIALTRIQQKIKDGKTSLMAEIYPGELKKILGSDNNIYRTLRQLGVQMTGRTMLIEDGKGNFKSFSFINNANYIDGTFTVIFNEELRPLISNLENKFTIYELSILTEFEHNSSYRLYELFKKEMYDTNPKMVNGEIHLEYNISELKFTIGICDIDNSSIKNERARMGNNIDYDILFSKLEKGSRKYERWNDFEKRVIIPAQQELKEKSNIWFEYEPVKTKGRKIGRIKFILHKQEYNNNNLINKQKVIAAGKKDFNEVINEDNRQLEIPMDLYVEIYNDYVGHNELTKEDIDLLLQKANYDKLKVVEAIEMADRQENLTNYMGWIIRCIEENYTNTETIRGSHETAVKVKSIQEDFESKIPDLAEKTWKKIKKRDNFPEFINFIKESGMTLSMYEELYECDERNKEYFQWLKTIKK